MKAAPDRTRVPSLSPAAAPAVEPPVRRSRRWVARLGSAAFWALVLGLLALNLDRFRNFWPPAAPTAITRLIERHQFDAAEAALRDRLRRDPFEGESRLMLARLTLGRGDHAGAAREFRMVPAWWPSKPEALVLEGQAALAAGLAVEAEAAWRAFLIDDPLHPVPARSYSTAANELISLLNVEGRQDESIATLWSIHDRSAPTDRPSVLASIMDLRLARVRYPTDPATLTNLQHYATADPNDIAARRALAGAAQAGGKWDDALRWLDSALAARPDDPAVRADRLAILHARGDTVGFAAEVDHLPQATGPDGTLDELRGLARDAVGDRAGAARFYRQAISSRPAAESLLDRLAQVAEAAGDPAEAGSCRCRAGMIRAARRDLPGAYQAYLGAVTQRLPVPEQGTLQARLAELCATVGWTREATAWKSPTVNSVRP